MSRKVAVLMGGWSPEREVSLVSGKACAEGLREGGHQVIEYDVKRDLRALIEFLRPSGGGGPDVVFNALHGKYGEDGCIQGVLEVLAVPYTHSGVLASAIAMDKPMARHVFTSLGMRVAEGRVIERQSLAWGDPMPRPYVVKPIDQGSSVGVHIVREGDNLAAVELAEAKFGDRVLVEKFVPGRELTVAVMGDKPIAVTELRPRTRFYDYEAKYTDGVTEHLVPAPIPAEVYELAKHWALMAHEALGCNGLTRTDLRWDNSKPDTSGLVVLEINTQPGMTPLVAGARAGQVGRHHLAAAHDLDGRQCEASGMKADPSEAPRRRDYDRRKKRAPIKKIGRPFWRQPLLLGLDRAAAGQRRGGRLVGVARGLAGRGAQSRRCDRPRHRRRRHALQAGRCHGRGPRLCRAQRHPGRARRQGGRFAARHRPAGLAPAARGRSTGWPAPPSSAACPTRSTSSWSSAAPSPSGRTATNTP